MHTSAGHYAYIYMYIHHEIERSEVKQVITHPKQGKNTELAALDGTLPTEPPAANR